MLKNITLWESLNELNSTIILHKGNYVKTTQDPYVSDDGKTYKAEAVSVFGDKLEVTWEVINEETDDESEVCDWDNPVSVEVKLY